MHHSNEERILELERQVKALKDRLDALQGGSGVVPLGGGGPGPDEEVPPGP